MAGVLTMPDSGPAPIERLIASAERSLLIKMFTFDYPPLVEAVLAAHRRGVKAVVLLNPAKINGLRLNDGTFERLRDAGVEVDWTSPAFVATHEKSVVVDDAVALIATFNFSEKHFTRTRDYGVLVDDAASVAEVKACFEADRERIAFGGRGLAGRGSLVWSNGNARQATADLIDGARRRLLIQHPKFNDPAILDRVLAAAARGVAVKLLCGGHHGIEAWDLMANLSSHRILARGGVRLRRQHHLRCHAKLMVADRRTALVGSMNIDAQAFDRRRELGVVLRDPTAVAGLHGRFRDDWRQAKPYRPEDPLESTPAELLAAHPADACGEDAALTHD